MLHVLIATFSKWRDNCELNRIKKREKIIIELAIIEYIFVFFSFFRIATSSIQVGNNKIFEEELGAKKMSRRLNLNCSVF